MEVLFDKDGNPYVMWGGNKIRLETSLNNDKCLRKAEEELRETPEVVANALAELRNLLKNEKELYIPSDRDDFLMKFLRPCKFYPESAFKRIQAYYKFKLSYPSYCSDLVPSSVRTGFEQSVISILAPRDQHGRRIILVESGEKWNPREMPLKEMFRCMHMGLEGAMVEPQTQICGVTCLIDMKGLSLRHVMQFTPSYAKMVLEWIQECVPMRLKAIHVVNQPYIFNMLFAIFKPFMSQKLRSRMYLHGTNTESLLEHVDPKALRKRHGGLLPDPEIPGNVLWQMLHHYEDDFKLASTYGYVSAKAINNNVIT